MCALLRVSVSVFVRMRGLEKEDRRWKGKCRQMVNVKRLEQFALLAVNIVKHGLSTIIFIWFFFKQGIFDDGNNLSFSVKNY